MFDLILTTVFSLPLIFVGRMYFKNRYSKGANLRDTLLASMGIVFYMSLVFILVSYLLIVYQSMAIPEYSEVIFLEHDLPSLLLDLLIMVVGTFAIFAAAFILGGLTASKSNKNQVPTDH